MNIPKFIFSLTILLQLGSQSLWSAVPSTFSESNFSVDAEKSRDYGIDFTNQHPYGEISLVDIMPEFFEDNCKLHYKGTFFLQFQVYNSSKQYLDHAAFIVPNSTALDIIFPSHSFP